MSKEYKQKLRDYSKNYGKAKKISYFVCVRVRVCVYMYSTKDKKSSFKISAILRLKKVHFKNISIQLI